MEKEKNELKNIVLIDGNLEVDFIRITQNQIDFLQQMIEDKIIQEICGLVVTKEEAINYNMFGNFPTIDWTNTVANSKTEKFFCTITPFKQDNFLLIVSADNLALLEWLEKGDLGNFELNYISINHVEE